jgi:hypothetical protein
MNNDYAEILSMYAAAMDDGVRRPQLADIADAAGMSADRVYALVKAAVKAQHLLEKRQCGPFCYVITTLGQTWLFDRDLAAKGAEGAPCMVEGCAFKAMATIPLCGGHERQLPGSLRSRWWGRSKVKALDDLREWAKTADVLPTPTRRAPATLPRTARRGYRRAANLNTGAILAALAEGLGDIEAATAVGVSAKEVEIVRRDWGLPRKWEERTS